MINLIDNKDKFIGWLSIAILSLFIPVHVHALTLIKGEQYELCRDLLPYLDKIEKEGKLFSRPIFTPDHPLFKAPVWKKEDKMQGFKVSTQEYASSSKTFKNWKKKLSNLEKKFNGEEFKYQVESAYFDVNNNGVQDKVLRGVQFDIRIKSWVYVNNVVTENLNLDLNFYGYEYGSSIAYVPGEFFFVQGAIFLNRVT